MYFFIKTLDKRIIIGYNSVCKVFLVYTKKAVTILAKDLSVSVLLDFYGELLTPKQAESLDLYYNQDLSLAEIAEDTGVSRQGVRAFIKQGEAHLINFEEKLGMAKRFAEISRLVEELENELPRKDSVKEKINEIKKRL